MMNVTGVDRKADSDYNDKLEQVKIVQSLLS